VRNKEDFFARHDITVKSQNKLNANDNFVVANDNFAPVAIAAAA